MSKTSTHLAFSELKWFEKVRGGSRGLNHSETVYRYPTHLVTTVGLRRFEGVEPLGNSVQVPYTTCSHCEDEVREGSVQSNHSELTSKTSTHLAFSEVVREGSRRFEGVEQL